MRRSTNVSRIATTNQEDIAVLEAFLEDIADVERITRKLVADAGFALASSLPPIVESQPPWRCASNWKATVRAVDILNHAADMQGGSADDDLDNLFSRCVASLRSWKQALQPNQQYLDGVLGRNTSHFSEAVGVVEKWVRQRVQKQSSSKREALRLSLEKLENIAGGKLGGGSWKAQLEEARGKASWDVVEHEASYHLVSLHTKLDEHFKEPTAATQDLESAQKDVVEAQVSSDSPTHPLAEELAKHVAAVLRAAEVTHTESRFADALLSTGPDRARKIKKRIESMAGDGTSCDELQPVSWRKVLLVSSSNTSGRALEPATPNCLKRSMR